MNNKQPKPHSHAELIKAWADGAKIQSRALLDYDNVEQWTKWTDNDEPEWWNEDYQFRIKPEKRNNKPWKPEEGISYLFVNSYGSVDEKPWDSSTIDYKRYENGNCFHFQPDAEAAAERVKDALKGTTNVSANIGSDVSRKDAEIKALKEELESLQIRCDNLNKAKEQLIASNAAIDGVTLTDGEIALIKALRLYDLSNITCNNKSALVVAEDASGKPTTNIIKQFVAFYPDFADNKKVHEDVISALEKIKEEQEAE